MIDIIRVYTTDETFPFIEKLLQDAFPLQERRDMDQQRYNTDYQSVFSCHVIKSNKIPIGFITYWNFDEFIYIEHFAISPGYRNYGYGSQVLDALKLITELPLVLEAEEPTDELSCRRIEFYRRNGFRLEAYPYLQPPYRDGDEWFPLKLMTYGMEGKDILYDRIKTCIYQYVYNQ